MQPANLFEGLPVNLDDEKFDDLIRARHCRIERILSHGQQSPEEGWYDQAEDEWVVVLEGAGEIQFASGEVVRLNRGDYLDIPAHTRHKVSWTDPERITFWLAVFYRG